MKKWILTTLIGLVAVGVVSTPIPAEAEKGGGEGAWATKRERMRERREKRGERSGLRMEKTIKSLGLSPEKEAKVREILKAHRKQRVAWRQENKELFQQLREARKAEDKDAVKQLVEKIKASHEEAQADLTKQLKGVLDEEQVKKIQRALRRGRQGPGWRRRPGRPVFAAVRRLDLSEQQRAQIKKILDDAEERIIKTLTPEQREKLKKMTERAREGKGRAQWGRPRRERHGKPGEGHGHEKSPETKD